MLTESFNDLYQRTAIDDCKLASLLQFDNEVQEALSAGYFLNDLLPRQALQLSLFPTPIKCLIGVDEMGRGSLAGPVVVGAVALPRIAKGSNIAAQLALLNEPKQLTANERWWLQSVIYKYARCSIGQATVEEINRLDITGATELAMRRTLSELIELLPHSAEEIAVLVDGRKPIEKLPYKQIAVVGADAKSAAVAAASIIAKEYRDACMAKLAEQFPGYDWHNNKGYPSKAHRQALLAFGITAEHRRSFAPCTDTAPQALQCKTDSGQL